MSVTTAMMFLVEATATCGPAAPPRLGGGAEVVRAILDVEEQVPEPPQPTLAGAGESTDVGPRYAAPETDDPDTDPTAALCKAERTSIA